VRLVSGVDYKGKLSSVAITMQKIDILHPSLYDFERLMISSGVLQCLDGYMNIAMEQTEEHVNGVVTNRYGDAFIRGNNG
jgi:small nuclear ribonucleoprotein (snRNP)-like protein